MGGGRNKAIIFAVVFVFLVFSFSFTSANIFTDAWNKITGNSVGNSVTYTCENLDSNSSYYFNICKSEGHVGVCFDKNSGEFQGCTDGSGTLCTINNVNKENNFFCVLNLSQNNSNEENRLYKSCDSGCFFNNDCVPVGYRNSKNQYCSVNNNFIPQLINSNSCLENYQCSSNYCENSVCSDPGFIRAIINWIESVF